MSETHENGPAPLDELNYALRWWWLVAALTVLGGLLGWGFHALQPPVYEARAVFSTSIDYVRTGALTDIEEDQAIAVVGDVLRSTDVMERTLAAAQAEGLALSASDWNAAATAERMGFRWLLRVRLNDPQLAAQVAGLWASEAQQALTNGLEHAQTVDALTRRLDTLGACLKNMAPALPVYTPCSPQELPALQAEISTLGAQIKDEMLASRGLLPAMTVELSAQPEIPTRAVMFGSSTLVGAGALLGLLAGVALLWLRVPSRLRGAA